MTCAALEHDPESRTTVLNPTIIVEVLSEGTQDYDRGEKGEHYRGISCLRAYVLVSHRLPSIEIWRRGSGGDWSREEHRAGASFELEGLRVSVDEIYRGTSIAESSAGL